MLLKVISGGQTGVDRAALDWALAHGLAVGGWCPAGRRAEDGPIDARYPLRETPSRGYAQRTRWNVRDSDGTLILGRRDLERGTAFTQRTAEKARHPYFLVQLECATARTAACVADWIGRNDIHVLNVAGPRESGRPGIHADAQQFLEQLARSLPASEAPARRATRSRR